MSVRECLGWSTADLADALGLDEWTVATFEREGAPPWTALALVGLLLAEGEGASSETISLVLGPSDAAADRAT